MRLDPHAEQARLVWVYDRLAKGWDETSVRCVMLALQPFPDHSPLPTKRRFAKAIIHEALRFEAEVRFLGEGEALPAAANALVNYIAVSSRFGGWPQEQLWEQTVNQISGRLDEMESTGQGRRQARPAT